MQIIKKSRVEVRDLSPEERARSEARAPRGAETCQKSVDLLRDRDQVVGIELRCSCGERTVIALDYDEPQASERQA